LAHPVTYDRLSVHLLSPLPASVGETGGGILLSRERYLNSVVAAALNK